MNLINATERAAYEAAIDDMHDTFSRDVSVIQEVKTPVSSLSENDDDYDFIHNKAISGPQEFTYSYLETLVKARIKYIDKQEKEFSLITTLGGEQLNLVQEFGFIRLKVRTADCSLVDEASHIIVDGNQCKVFFRDRPHGLFDSKYCTFYVQRVP
jgi:hypothetical protein